MLCIVGQKKIHTYSTNWTVIFGLASTHTHTEITFNGKTHGIVMCNDRHLPYWICHTQIAKRRPKIVFFFCLGAGPNVNDIFLFVFITCFAWKRMIRCTELIWNTNEFRISSDFRSEISSRFWLSESSGCVILQAILLWIAYDFEQMCSFEFSW